jgi:hypothetical protein
MEHLSNRVALQTPRDGNLVGHERRGRSQMQRVASDFVTRGQPAFETIVVRNYSRSLCSRSALIERSRVRTHRRNEIFMMQTSQDRFREYERTRRQSMSGFGLRDYPNSSRRIRHARA